ncbi:MAG: hypothetical protein M0P70_13965 [Desulfobulbaceae bacterium]|nr:hypothetical protein [Desulfobulbaceae bacterium]
MSHFEKHNETTLRLLGKDFVQVHAFLDRFYPIYGASHRNIFHHQAGIELIVKKIGEDARDAAEIHIIEDLLPQADIEKWRELRHLIPASWVDYGEPFFLKLEMYDQYEAELENLYGKSDVQSK